MSKRYFSLIFTFAISTASLAVENVAIEQPENPQALCSVFDGLNIDEVTDSEEQLRLGLISELRSLKCRDTKRAKLLLERSAMQGNAEAQYHLCQWYAEREDGVNVIAWCFLSSEFGSSKGKRAYNFYKKQVVESAYNEGIKRAESLKNEISK